MQSRTGEGCGLEKRGMAGEGMWDVEILKGQRGLEGLRFPTPDLNDCLVSQICRVSPELLMDSVHRILRLMA